MICTFSMGNSEVQFKIYEGFTCLEALSLTAVISSEAALTKSLTKERYVYLCQNSHVEST